MELDTDSALVIRRICRPKVASPNLIKPENYTNNMSVISNIWLNTRQLHRLALFITIYRVEVILCSRLCYIGVDTFLYLYKNYYLYT